MKWDPRITSQQHNQPWRETRERGFSLIELAVTMAVLFVLAGMLSPPIWVATKREGRPATEQHLIRLSRSILQFHEDTSTLPISLTQLVTDPLISGWLGPYVETDAGPSSGYDLDAFGTKLSYSRTGKIVSITSNGFDRISGTADDIVGVTDITPRLAAITRERVELLNAAVVAYLRRMGPSTITLPLTVPGTFSQLVTSGVIPNNAALLLDGFGQTMTSDPPTPQAATSLAAFRSPEIGSSP